MSGVFADGQGHLLNEGQATTLEGLDVSVLFALNFVQGQTYTVEETRAPAGYELISGKLTFSVDTGGKASLDASGSPTAAMPSLLTAWPSRLSTCPSRRR